MVDFIVVLVFVVVVLFDNQRPRFQIGCLESGKAWVSDASVGLCRWSDGLLGDHRGCLRSEKPHRAPTTSPSSTPALDCGTDMIQGSGAWC